MDIRALGRERGSAMRWNMESVVLLMKNHSEWGYLFGSDSFGNCAGRVLHGHVSYYCDDVYAFPSLQFRFGLFVDLSLKVTYRFLQILFTRFAIHRSVNSIIAPIR